MLLENSERVCNGVDMSILKGGVYKGDSCINGIGEGILWMVVWCFLLITINVMVRQMEHVMDVTEKKIFGFYSLSNWFQIKFIF